MENEQPSELIIIYEEQRKLIAKIIKRLLAENGFSVNDYSIEGTATEDGLLRIENLSGIFKNKVILIIADENFIIPISQIQRVSESVQKTILYFQEEILSMTLSDIYKVMPAAHVLVGDISQDSLIDIMKSPNASSGKIEKREQIDSLTATEIKVLYLLSFFDTQGAVGRVLGISSRTVNKHVSAIRKKLGLHLQVSVTRKFKEFWGRVVQARAEGNLENFHV